MPRFLMLSLPLCLISAPQCFAQYPPSPVIIGVVTSVAAPSVVDVDGYHIQIGPKTVVSLRTSDRRVLMPLEQTKPFIGELVRVFGKIKAKEHAIAATRLELIDYEPHQVTGSGVMDAIPANTSVSSTDRLIRADGYFVLLTPNTDVKYVAPLSATSPFVTNLWIVFQGVQRPDGIVEADVATISRNIIGGGEDKLRTKAEYDPTAVDADAHQNSVSKTFLGLDPKQIPPFEDVAMQNRVSDLGKRLIPQYQRDLSASDGSKIDFRFQVVDQPKWHDAYTLPNGIILIPREVVERMQNDTQLATVLADNIACALEKQTLHAQGLKRTLNGTEIAATAAGIFVPGLGLASWVGGGIVSERLTEKSHQQSGRVSLGLLRDAGFDIQQAPLAWWLLAAKKDKGVEETPIPSRAAYLYQMIGTTWHPQP